MRDINLLKVYIQKPERQLSLIKKIKLTAVISLAAYCLLVGILFSYWFYLNRSHDRVAEKTRQLEVETRRLQQAETSYLLVKQKLKSLLSYWNGEDFSYQKNLSRFREISYGVRLSGLEMSGRQMKISGEAPQAVAYHNYLNRILSDDTLFFNEVIHESSSRNKDGSYRFSMSLNAKSQK